MISIKWLFRIAGAQALLIVILSTALFLSFPFSEGEVHTTVDSTASTTVDSTERLTGVQWFLSGPEPSDTLEEAQETEVPTCPSGNKRIMERDSTGRDTVYVSKTTPVVSYSRQVTRPRVSGQITSVVKGELLEQSVDLSVRSWDIESGVTHTVTRTKTRVQRPRLEVLGAASAVGGAGKIGVYVGGGVRFPGSFSALYQVNPLAMTHQVTLTRPLFSL